LSISPSRRDGSRIQAEIIGVSDPLILTAGRVTSDVGDKGESWNKALLFDPGSFAVPVTEEMIAWKDELQGPEINVSLRAVAVLLGTD